MYQTDDELMDLVAVPYKAWVWYQPNGSEKHVTHWIVAAIFNMEEDRWNYVRDWETMTQKVFPHISEAINQESASLLSADRMMI